MNFVKRSPYIARRKTKIINNDAGNGTTGPKVRQSTQELALPYMAAGSPPPNRYPAWAGPGQQKKALLIVWS